MKRAITVVLGFMLTLAVGILVWPNLGPPAQAQPGCQSFRAIAQATLPTSTPLAATDTWGGLLYGMLGGEFLSGVLSGNDGDETFRSHMGTGKGGAYTVGVGCAPGVLYVCTDSFTYEVPNAVFPIPPGKIGFAYYIGNTAKIVGGTGRFVSASGDLNVSGPAIVSLDVFPVGRWNVELSGQVCGVE